MTDKRCNPFPNVVLQGVVRRGPVSSSIVAQGSAKDAGNTRLVGQASPSSERRCDSPLGGRCRLSIGVHSRRSVALILVALSVTASATADMIPVLNPSFDDQVFASPGDYTGFITDWVTSGNAGVLWPTAAEFPAGAPEGRNVAGAGEITTPGSISQILSTTLEADTTYTLKVDVGERLDYPFFASYTVALIANGITLASDSSLRPSPGAFLTDVIQYSSGADPSQLGQNLEILLSSPAGGQASFDDIRLDASAVPEPGSTGLMISGGLGLACLRRCRRTLRRRAARPTPGTGEGQVEEPSSDAA